MILYNGALVTKDSVCISHEDRGYYFGDGVYEVFRIYNGQLYEKQAHLARLERSSREIKLQLNYTLAQIDEMLEQLLLSENVREGTLYLQITRGIAARSHTFPERTSPTLLAYITPVDRPLQTIRNGINAISRADFRWLRCDIKSLNLLPNTMLKQEAIDHNAHEVVLQRDGIVTECSASNLMMVQHGEIYTHPANHLILHGITRATVLRLAESLSISAKEQPFTLDQLYQADEVFITGTTVEITPVLSIDGQTIGNGKPGTITKKLQNAFEQTIQL